MFIKSVQFHTAFTSLFISVGILLSSCGNKGTAGPAGPEGSVAQLEQME